MGARETVRTVRQALKELGEDGAMTLAASLAYSAALSMAPLVTLALWVASILGPKAQQDLVAQITSMVGSSGGEAIELVIQGASEQPSAGNVAGLLGIVTLVLGASAVFGQLQSSMNRIWGVRPRPGRGVGGWLRKRLTSVGILLAVLVLLIASTVATTMIAATADSATGLPGGATLWSAVSLVLTAAIFAVLFAMLFRYLPDARVTWADVRFGAIVTALLFAVGKHALALYLAHGSVGSAYGAAGSLVVFLVWTYYSALIFFFGAELTQVHARRVGHAIEPKAYAERVERVELSERDLERSASPARS